MLILSKKDLQETIEINGIKIPIRTDFRTWIKFSCILADKKINDVYKSFLLLDTVLFSHYENIETDKAINELLKFYFCNKTIPAQKKSSNKIGFLFEYDMDLIYAAFMQQYKIDILSVELHWWEFKALLNGLTDETKFVEIVGYRVIDLSKIKDKKERQRLQELQEHYKIKDVENTRTQEEIEAELFKKLKAESEGR